MSSSLEAEAGSRAEKMSELPERQRHSKTAMLLDPDQSRIRVGLLVDRDQPHTAY